MPLPQVRWSASLALFLKNEKRYCYRSSGNWLYLGDKGCSIVKKEVFGRVGAVVHGHDHIELPVLVYIRKGYGSRDQVCALICKVGHDIQAWLVRRAWIGGNFNNLDGSVIVQSNKMLHSSMSDIGVCLECSRVSVGSIIAPFLKGWRNERIGSEEYNQYHQADTDVEQRVFSLTRYFLCSSLSSAVTV